MDLKETLKNFNISQKETEIYLAALELGESSANEIAKKIAVHRTYFYDLARKLIAIGLLKQIKKGRRIYFIATDPEKLVGLQEQKLEELKRAIPLLKAVAGESNQRPRVYFFEGRAGIDEINNETLRHRGEIIGLTTPRFLTTDQQMLSDKYIKKRLALKKKVRVIGQVSEALLKLKERDKNELRETRLLPADLFRSEIELGVFADKVFVVNYKDEFGMIIDDKEVASVLRQVFEIIWSSGKII